MLRYRYEMLTWTPLGTISKNGICRWITCTKLPWCNDNFWFHIACPSTALGLRCSSPTGRLWRELRSFSQDRFWSRNQVSCALEPSLCPLSYGGPLIFTRLVEEVQDSAYKQNKGFVLNGWFSLPPDGTIVLPGNAHVLNQWCHKPKQSC